MYTTAATTRVRTVRNTEVDVMILRRSTLSVITPAGSVKRSHGRRCAIAMSAMRRAFRVTAEANHGYAIPATPSPRFDVTLAVQSFQ